MYWLTGARNNPNVRPLIVLANPAISQHGQFCCPAGHTGQPDHYTQLIDIFGQHNSKFLGTTQFLFICVKSVISKYNHMKSSTGIYTCLMLCICAEHTIFWYCRLLIATTNFTSLHGSNFTWMANKRDPTCYQILCVCSIAVVMQVPSVLLFYLSGSKVFHFHFICALQYLP